MPRVKYEDLRGYDLLHEGTLALSEVSMNGICVDLDQASIEENLIDQEIKVLTDRVMQAKEVQLWKQEEGDNFNLGSTEQLGRLLYERMGITCKYRTAKDKPKVDETALKDISRKVPFLVDYLHIKKLSKVKNTYIKNFIKEVDDDGRMHPDFDLNSTLTYRSSSYNPNFQNIPIRNKDLGPRLRRLIVPRKDHLIIEADYSGIEVCGSACYHRDPQMIKYIIDPTTDMHSDVAKDVFILGPTEWNKAIRQSAKGNFVFAQFYGSYYADCAQRLWKDIETSDLKTNQGVPLYAHLKKHGISTYPQFERHIEKVCDSFWNDRFPVYTKWKAEWYDAYLEKGYFDTLTGFRCSGFMRRNAVLNYPIQGSSFHCLLWTLIHLNKELKLNEMRSRICGQIHDSVFIDTHPEELNRTVSMIQRIGTVEIRKVWDWIIVPLKIEVDATPPNGSWNDKKEISPHKCGACGCAWAYSKQLPGEDFVAHTCVLCGDREKEFRER